MVGKCLIIKYQVLQRSLFDGLQDKTVGAVDRGNNLYRPLLKPDCRDRTVSDADAAAKTDIFIYHSFPPACLLPFSGRIFFLHPDRQHRTYLGTFSAADAGFHIN